MRTEGEGDGIHLLAIACDRIARAHSSGPFSLAVLRIRTHSVEHGCVVRHQKSPKVLKSIVCNDVRLAYEMPLASSIDAAVALTRVETPREFTGSGVSQKLLVLPRSVLQCYRRRLARGVSVFALFDYGIRQRAVRKLLSHFRLSASSLSPRRSVLAGTLAEAPREQTAPCCNSQDDERNLHASVNGCEHPVRVRLSLKLMRCNILKLRRSSQWNTIGSAAKPATFFPKRIFQYVT